MINDEALLGAFTGLGVEPGPARPAPKLPAQRKRASYAPPLKEHQSERVADELETYMTEMPDLLYDALAPDGRPPFSTGAPKQEQLDFWFARLFQPDGTVNLEAVGDLVANATPAEVHELAGAIRERRGGEAA